MCCFNKVNLSAILLVHMRIIKFNMYHTSQMTTKQKQREVLKTQQQINTRCWSITYKVYVGGQTENQAKIFHQLI